MSQARSLLATVAVATLALAACTPGSGGGGGATDDPGGATDDAGGEVVTDISELGEVTLVVWDQEVRGGQNEQMEQLNAAFTDTYPNVTIERNSQSNDDLQTTLRLALTGEDAPDVAQVNNSRSQMGQYVAAEQSLEQRVGLRTTELPLGDPGQLQHRHEVVHVCGHGAIIPRCQG